MNNATAPTTAEVKTALKNAGANDYIIAVITSVEFAKKVASGLTMEEAFAECQHETYVRVTKAAQTNPEFAMAMAERTYYAIRLARSPFNQPIN